MRSDAVLDVAIMCIYSGFLVLYFSEILVYVIPSLWKMSMQSALKSKKILYADNRDNIHCCYINGK